MTDDGPATTAAPDPAAYDEVVGRLDGGMVAVTAWDGEESAGCLVGFHSQAGIEPRRHALWLSKANHTYRVALHSDLLGVHLLDRAQHDLAELLGGVSGDEVEDKLSRLPTDPGPGGLPLLRGVPARFVGSVAAVLDVGGDHVCFVLDVAAVERSGSGFEPLRLSQVEDVEPGHRAEETPVPQQTQQA